MNPKVTLYVNKGDASDGLLRFEWTPGPRTLEVPLDARLVGPLLALKLAWKTHGSLNIPGAMRGRIKFSRIASIMDRDPHGYRLGDTTIENYIFQIRRAIREAAREARMDAPVLLGRCVNKSIGLACELDVVELDEQIKWDDLSRSETKDEIKKEG